ncbi:MAG: N-acetylglucosamine kinase [Cyclobacteriaceae bacterium]|nr:N-acetylglucosamine kinase [Cyclobacteriaceae bacterium]
MILIADSGSTKTDWRIVQQDSPEIIAFSGTGINPYYTDKETLIKQVQSEVRENLHEEPEKVFFYGAGCATDAGIASVKDFLQEIFPTADIEVASDLLGAARSLCQQEAGIACIIGTGSNSCVYDGQSIRDHIPPLGYILGDEGSGSYLGKRLIADYFKRIMPVEIMENFKASYSPDLDTLYDNLFRKPYPNRYLAKFAQFIIENANDAYCTDLVYDGFLEFFERNIKKYPNYKNYPLYFTGSMAFFFKPVLKELAKTSGLVLKKITQHPADGLAEYHKNF